LLSQILIIGKIPDIGYSSKILIFVIRLGKFIYQFLILVKTQEVGIVALYFSLYIFIFQTPSILIIIL